MKKYIKIILLLFNIIFFFSCNSISPNIFSDINDQNIQLSSDLLEIYFPEFYTSDNKVINGDGILVKLPNNIIILIDSFKPKAGDQLVNFIKGMNIDKIDYLISSHHHVDHIGSMKQIIENFEIGLFLDNGIPFDTLPSKELYETLDKYNIPRKILESDDTINLSNDCIINVFWPDLSENKKYDAFIHKGKSEKSRNNTSLVFKLSYNKFSILFTGDIYKQYDKEIVKRYGPKLQSTILKVPHHGDYYTASSNKFIKAVNPKYGIIQDNRYITKTIINRYKQNKTELLYRKTPGYIYVKSDGINYSINSIDI